MKSRAHFKSHPIHPMLIAFPIAFFTGAFLFDLLAYLMVTEDFRRTSFFLIIAGIIGGIVAAIPGLIDLVSVVPPKSSAKKRGIKHGLLNTTVLLLFALCLSIWNRTDLDHRIITVIQFIAVILLAVTGYMGATLIYRNQIGVDIRYAHAGKWKEIYSEINNRQIEIPFENLKENQMRLIHASGKRIVLARSDNEYVAFDDHCTHRGGSLAGGSMICGTVQCPWHGSQFDVRNGTVKAGPAKESIKTYKVMQEGERLIIQL